MKQRLQGGSQAQDEYNFDKLLAHYQSEKTNHDPVSKHAEVRLQKCETSAKVQWKSLPF